MQQTIAAAQSKVPLSPSLWKAKWIWTQDICEGRHDFVHFRREFGVDSVGRSVLMSVTAEREYAVWLNGVFIGRGPALSSPNFKRFDTFEIAWQLRKGKNCVAALVYHDVHHARLTEHATARGFLCQIDLNNEFLVSDETWKASRSRAWISPSTQFDDTTLAEFFDARRSFVGWESLGFGDSTWPNAIPVIPAYNELWGSPQNQSRHVPWVNLVPSEVSSPIYEKHKPERLHQVGEVLQRREASHHDTAIRMSLEPILPISKSSLLHQERLLLDTQGAVTVRNSDPNEASDTFDGLRNATLILDFGKIMNARLGFRMKASEGVKIDIGYAYRLEDERVVPYVSYRNPMADQYTTLAGMQTWQTFQWRHFRYVQITFRDLADELELFQIWAEEVRCDMQARGHFECEDDLVTRSFRMSQRTIEVSTVDRLMDNASRERRQYLGDGSGVLPALWSIYGDAAIARKYLTQFHETQRPTGFYPFSSIGHDNDYSSVFDHALSFPVRLLEHVMIYNDRAFAGKLWPGVQRFLTFCESLINHEGFVESVPYPIWFDWAHIDRRGISFLLNAFVAEVFQSAASLEQLLGRGEDSQRWVRSSQRLKKFLQEEFFDNSRGMFVDSLVNGRKGTHTSEHTNSLALHLQIARPDQARGILDAFDRQQSTLGTAQPIWMYLPLALIRAGRTDLGIRWTRKHYSQLERQGFETVPELWCLHGEKTTGSWRCRNSRAVAQATGLGVPWALLTEICGIQPAEPGFRTVRFAPQPGPLASFYGKFPGPDGEYSISYKKLDQRHQVHIAIPEEKTVLLDVSFVEPGTAILLEGKQYTSDEIATLPIGRQAPRYRLRGGKEFRVEIPSR